ncbi:MAG TPA: hypothetical protein VEI03_04205 [Stellaceae bacterium]|nr:hypothetical protein [Stellaceae bacterium]
MTVISAASWAKFARGGWQPTKATRRFGLTAVVVAATVAACAPIQSGPPVAPNFVFAPPSSNSATHYNMSIGILRPLGAGQAPGENFFVTNVPIFANGKAVIDQMLTATQADIERIIIARGFTTAGAYSTIDEMTFSAKERATLILRPTFTVNLTVMNVPFGQSTATIGGYAVLELLEPMSREKVWIKRLDLAPITRPVQLQPGQIGNQLVSVISTNSMTDLLNVFYMPMMAKMWDQLDGREIETLKRDADKLKAATRYRGG